MSIDNSFAEFKALSGAINKERSFTDFTIRLSGVQKEIHVHKIVISQNSSFFRKLFEENPQAREQLVGKVPYDVMLYVLTFLYDGRMEPVPDDFPLIRMLSCAARLGIRPLVRLTFNEIGMKLATCNEESKEMIMDITLVVIEQSRKTKTLNAEDFVEILTKAELNDSVLELFTKKVLDETKYPGLASAILLGLLKGGRK